MPAAPIHLGFTPTSQLLGFNSALVKEIPHPAFFFAALAGGGFFARGTHTFWVCPARIFRVYPYADFAAEGVKLVSVSFSVNPSLLCT